MPDISIPSSSTPAAPDARGANGDTRASSADPSDAGAASVFGALLFAQIGIVPPPPTPAATTEAPPATGGAAGDAVSAATRAIPDWQTLVELATKDAGQVQANAVEITASDGAATDPASTTAPSTGKIAVSVPGLEAPASDAKAQTASASFQALARDAIEALGKKATTAPGVAAADGSPPHHAANRAPANLAKHDRAAAMATSSAMAEQQSPAATEPSAPTASAGKNTAPGLDGARGASTESDAPRTAAFDTVMTNGANANAAQAAQATLPAHDTGTGNAAVSLQATVGSPAWTDELGHKVNYLIHGKTQTAELHLNPRELGPVSIQIKLETNQATLAFTAQHAETRQALEAALPRLRELLADSGITLTQATVGGDMTAQQQAFGDLSQQAPRQFAARSSAGANSSERISAAPEPATAPTRARRSDGLVDTFA